MNWYKIAKKEKKPYKIYKVNNGQYEEMKEFTHIWTYSPEQARSMALRNSQKLRDFVEYCMRSNAEGDVVARIDKEKLQEVKNNNESLNIRKEEQIQEAWWNK